MYVMVRIAWCAHTNQNSYPLMKQLQEILKRVLIENAELKKKIQVLETILRSYIPVIGGKNKDEI